jgi:hypothetical protein
MPDIEQNGCSKESLRLCWGSLGKSVVAHRRQTKTLLASASNCHSENENDNRNYEHDPKNSRKKGVQNERCDKYCDGDHGKDKPTKEKFQSGQMTQSLGCARFMRGRPVQDSNLKSLIRVTRVYLYLDARPAARRQVAPGDDSSCGPLLHFKPSPVSPYLSRITSNRSPVHPIPRQGPDLRAIQTNVIPEVPLCDKKSSRERGILHHTT